MVSGTGWPFLVMITCFFIKYIYVRGEKGSLNQRKILSSHSFSAVFQNSQRCYKNGHGLENTELNYAWEFLSEGNFLMENSGPCCLFANNTYAPGTSHLTCIILQEP